MQVPADVPDDEGDDSGASVAVVDTQAAADEVDAERVIVRGGDETDADTDDGPLDTPLSEADMTVGELARLVARETIGALDDDGLLDADAFDAAAVEGEDADDGEGEADGDDEDAEPADADDAPHRAEGDTSPGPGDGAQAPVDRGYY